MVFYADTEYEQGVYRDYVEAREMKIEHFRKRQFGDVLNRVINEAEQLCALDGGLQASAIAATLDQVRPIALDLLVHVHGDFERTARRN